jgi:hypothetical protein
MCSEEIYDYGTKSEKQLIYSCMNKNNIRIIRDLVLTLMFVFMSVYMSYGLFGYFFQEYKKIGVYTDRQIFLHTVENIKSEIPMDKIIGYHDTDTNPSNNIVYFLRAQYVLAPRVMKRNIEFDHVLLYNINQLPIPKELPANYMKIKDFDLSLSLWEKKR